MANLPALTFDVLVSIPAVYSHGTAVTIVGQNVRITFIDALGESAAVRSAVVMPAEAAQKMGEMILTLLAQEGTRQ